MTILHTTIGIRISDQLIEAFAKLTGDRSSIHIDPEFGRLSRFRRPVMHGMLPLVYLAGWVSANHPKAAVTRLTCQFLEPCFSGDELRIEIGLPPEPGSPLYSFKIFNASSGAVHTKGEFELTQSGQPLPPNGVAESGLASALTENSLSLKSITAGMKESFTVTVGPDCNRNIAAVFEQHRIDFQSELNLANLGHNSFALLFISTFIGMRIPGRYATLAEIAVRFTAPVSAGEIGISGTVDKVMPGSSRIKVGFSWIQGETVVATGHAWSLVGEPHPQPLKVEEIRDRFLPLGINGKVALITGASRGIGEATAKLLALNGAKVAVHYFRGQSAADTIVREIEAAGGTAAAVGADIRDEAQVQAMFKQIEAKFGPVDILVNNAVDQFSPKEFSEISWQDYISELDVSLRGLHACCRQAVPSMRDRKWGKIVNLGTIAVETPVSGQNKYITVKSALTGYTRSLAAELARDNIQVNLVVPRMTRTTLIAGLPGELVRRLAEESASGAILEPIEVARAIVFLVSEWANPISGQKLVLNQGESPYI